MAVEQETSGILFLFLWVCTVERELGPISRSDEDLTTLVVLACSILPFGIIRSVCLYTLAVGLCFCVLTLFVVIIALVVHDI